MRVFIPVFLILFLVNLGFSQNPTKVLNAERCKTAIKIDGKLDDEGWKNVVGVSDFIQYTPINNVAPTQKTFVKILYDDDAIYVGALMLDSSPDSILRELGSRDNELNADNFSIEFDTYNKQQDGYTFLVYASGVQADFREWDETYDAVWESKVNITEKGWIVEMKIPYSAIRFPKIEEQVWGMEINRGIRRNRETDQWALQLKGTGNDLVYWGKLKGLKKIKPPLRLSFTPYFSLYGEHYPYNVKSHSDLSGSINGGMDLKYGVNESYTIDMTLLPDFSQVQSDNKVKNLSAFETVYEEQRPFFKEAVDLFSKGNLFYSRRIGKQPTGFYDVEYNLKEGEFIKKNPLQTKLLNSTKFSGRGKNGLAIGLFNSITDNTYAVIEDSLGNKRNYLTEPLANYNIFVLDQAFKNNSSFYVINTNVTRDKNFGNSNVTGSGLKLVNKKNSYQFALEGTLSDKYIAVDTLFNNTNNSLGYKYATSFAKIKGNFHFTLWKSTMNKTYNPNDMGLNLSNNEESTGLDLKYNIYEPFGKFRNFNNYLSFTYNNNFTSKKVTSNSLEYRMSTTFLNYLSLWGGTYCMLQNVYDYYEPRVEGRFFRYPTFYNVFLGLSSDYRKAFAFDLEMRYSQTPNFHSDDYSVYLRPIARLSDNLKVDFAVNYTKNFNNIGFVNVDDSNNVVFGKRELTTIENTFTGRYMFENNLSLSLRLRHYLVNGEYNQYYILNEEGDLDENNTYNNNSNFNFNSFNIDLLFAWEFAPGSTLSLAWKNAIMDEKAVVVRNYIDNIENTINSPQLNSLSLKVLYYLDYQYLKRKRK
ncbi:MAG: carbohydrate binding family 9 domain-containing protein [Bacteroidetes bacterium]|nr:carbohydrate binding family 9 domain-containing protein [Bacteroidota bacterium]